MDITVQVGIMGSSPTKNLKLPQQKDIYDTGNDVSVLKAHIFS